MVEIPHHPSRSTPMMTDRPATVYLDIETIPSQEMWIQEYVAETIKPPGQMKKQETIDKWMAEEKQNAIDDALDKCALDGAMNHIVCMSVAIDDHPPIAFYAEDHKKESSLLIGFYDYVTENCGKWGDKNRYVGHNISGFDFKILKQRSIILGIRPPAGMPFDVKPWESVRLYDTMVQWDAKVFVKLDKIARALGIAGKTMDGSHVYGMWKNGLIRQIADYCNADVEMTRKVYKRMEYLA